MNGKRISASLLLGLAVLAGGFRTSPGAAPWSQILLLSRVEADPDKEYLLTEENGPWIITACSFSGEGAEEQARQLVHELRKRYKLPAYMHRVRFDFQDPRGRGIDRFGAPLRMRYRRGSELEEVAVMVGDYPAVDDPQAQKTLQKLKYCHPRCLEIEGGKPTHQSLAGWRMAQRRLHELIGSEQKEKGPMGHAFITTNPLLPKQFFASPGIDPEVVQWNDGLKYSLLNCPGKYTVQVATFKGQVIIDQREIKAIEQGKKVRSKLAEATEKAHKLAEALRLKGWEAYEFHDRHASIVTVGSFDCVGTPRPDGRIEINPAIHAVMRTFGADQTAPPGQPPRAMSPKSLVGIYFDIQPVPVHVPRRSVAREMAGGLF